MIFRITPGTVQPEVPRIDRQSSCHCQDNGAAEGNELIAANSRNYSRRRILVRPEKWHIIVKGLTKVVEMWGVDYDTVVEGLPPLLCLGIATAKYGNGVIQLKKFQDIFLSMKSDSVRLMNLPEYDVLQKYVLRGRIFVLQSTAYYATSIVLYFLFSTTMLVYFETHPINGTVTRELMYPMEFYINETERTNFYLLTLHCYGSTMLGLYLISALDAMYIVLTQHACALFAVAGYRLKTAHVLDNNALKENKDVESWKKKIFTAEEQRQIYHRIILSIKEHKRALEFTQLFQSVFSISLFVQLGLNILALSITGLQVLLKFGNIHATLRLETLLVGQLFHLFLICLPGQRLVDYSNKFYYDSLDCNWYSFSKRTTVLYHILSTNSITPSKLVAMKMIPLNMETYLTVTKTAMSYFTVLTSTR